MKAKDLLVEVNLNIDRIYELEVSNNYISGTSVIVDIPITDEIKIGLEKEIVETGYWVYMMTGHSIEFIIVNFDTKEEAEKYLKEKIDDDFLSEVFIVDM